LTYLEGIELHVRVAVSKPLDHALDSFLGAILVRLHAVADFHDLPPVLGREVLIGSFVCK